MSDDGLCKEVNPFLAHDEDGEMALWCGLPRGHNGQHEDARAVILELRSQLDAIQKEANMMIEGLFNASVREEKQTSQLSALREALEGARVMHQPSCPAIWEHGKCNCWVGPHNARIAAALASTEPGGEERKPSP